MRINSMKSGEKIEKPFIYDCAANRCSWKCRGEYTVLCCKRCDNTSGLHQWNKEVFPPRTEGIV